MLCRALVVLAALASAAPMPILALSAAALRGDWFVAALPCALYAALAASGVWWVGVRRETRS
jgi:hypothetical protein